MANPSVATPFEIVEVSEEELIRRLNRVLDSYGLRIRKTPDGSQARHKLGMFFVMDIESNTCNQKYIDLEQYARDHNCLAALETLIASD
jgi:hypothetical protein